MPVSPPTLFSDWNITVWVTLASAELIQFRRTMPSVIDTTQSSSIFYKAD